MKSIMEHKEDYGKLIKQSKTFQENAENYVDSNIDDGLFTDEAMASFNALTESIEAKKRQIDALERAERQIAPDNSTPATNRQTVPATPVDADERARGGWNTFGEFSKAVMQASLPNGERDPRLGVSAAAATTYSNEGTGSEGGFAIPEQFSNEIMSLMLEGDSLLPYTDNYPVAGNSMVFPGCETTPWGTTGVKSYWTGEAAQATESKMVLTRTRLELFKLMALAPVTDEMLEDSRVAGTFVMRKIAESIRWKTNDAIVNGTGVGQPLGFFKSGALATVAKEASQTADTINAANLGKMYGSCPPSMIKGGVWIINPDSYGQLINMTLGNQPIWTPPNEGMKNAPGGTVLGLPVIISQSCQTLGDLGDIFFAGLGSYLTITKAGGIKSDTSIHLYFDYGETAFRSTFRMDGRPWMQSTITPPNSSVAMSPFVALAARA